MTCSVVGLVGRRLSDHYVYRILTPNVTVYSHKARILKIKVAVIKILLIR